jgi:acyl-coenzyme A thioesterase PaaI-like protein
MKTLGASLELVEPGRVHIAVPFSPALTQQHGYVYAGVISSIADSACGYAAMTLAPNGAEVLSKAKQKAATQRGVATFRQS